VIQEAWIGGVSTRRVDDLVQAMGLAGISKSQVSKLCKSLPPRRRGTSTSGCMPFSIGRAPANGPIGGSTPLP
jgi:Transposase, Mutator family